jgi:acetylornithine/succinyldiaminopimelate/putrescine aminotransferase
VRFKGKVLKSALEVLAERVPGAEVRGEGLLVGLGSQGPRPGAVGLRALLDEGLLVNLVGGTTIRLAPPLTVTRTEVRAALDTFRGGVRAAMSVAVPEAAVA